MFTNLDTWLNVLLTILVVIGCLYILGLIVDLIFIFSFKHILKIHNKTLNVALTTKYIYIEKLIELMEENSVEIDPKYIEQFKTINTKHFKHQDCHDCKNARDILNNLRYELFFIAKKEKNVEELKAFITDKSCIKELDENYRDAVAMYNADVLGYNYWVRFLPYKWIFLLFKIKTKELI